MPIEAPKSSGIAAFKDELDHTKATNSVAHNKPVEPNEEETSMISAQNKHTEQNKKENPKFSSTDLGKMDSKTDRDDGVRALLPEAVVPNPSPNILNSSDISPQRSVRRSGDAFADAAIITASSAPEPILKNKMKQNQQINRTDESTYQKEKTSQDMDSLPKNFMHDSSEVPIPTSGLTKEPKKDSSSRNANSLAQTSLEIAKTSKNISSFLNASKKQQSMTKTSDGLAARAAEEKTGSTLVSTGLEVPFLVEKPSMNGLKNGESQASLRNSGEYTLPPAKLKVLGFEGINSQVQYKPTKGFVYKHFPEPRLHPEGMFRSKVMANYYIYTHTFHYCRIRILDKSFY